MKKIAKQLVRAEHPLYRSEDHRLYRLNLIFNTAEPLPAEFLFSYLNQYFQLRSDGEVEPGTMSRLHEYLVSSESPIPIILNAPADPDCVGHYGF